VRGAVVRRLVRAIQATCRIPGAHAIDYRRIMIAGGRAGDAGRRGWGAVFRFEMRARVDAAVDVPRPSPWVRSPGWDGFWLLGALWLTPIALWLSRGHADPEESPLDLFYCGLTALFWIGHRLSSVHLAYCTEAYRPLVRAQPVRFVVVPALVTGACFAIFLPADAALPWTRAERLVAVAILDYLLVTQHFAAQHFGALSLYRTRAGRAGSVRARNVDRLFALGVGGALVVLADVLAGAVAYQDQWVDRWLLPAWVVSSEEGIRTGATVVLLAATAAMLVAELRAPRWSLPRMLYVLGMATMVALALRSRSPFLFLVIWTSQHWILATGLAAQAPAAEPAPVRGVGRRALHAFNVRPWALVLLLMLSSIALLPLFDVEGSRLEGTYYADRIFGALAAGLRTSAWIPALLALGFATGFVHYLLDRSVYRLSDPRVRAAARGLLTAADRGTAIDAGTWAGARRRSGSRGARGGPPRGAATAPAARYSASESTWPTAGSTRPSTMSR
jgi:hypothetical protein